MISVVGTLISDNLSDNQGIPLETTTLVFSAALIGTFAIWYAFEETLSIHTIFTTRREVFYWLAILFTFALRTFAVTTVFRCSLGLGKVAFYNRHRHLLSTPRRAQPPARSVVFLRGPHLSRRQASAVPSCGGPTR